LEQLLQEFPTNSIAKSAQTALDKLKAKEGNNGKGN
jgi:hypothetical protein